MKTNRVHTRGQSNEKTPFEAGALGFVVTIALLVVLKALFG